MTRAVCIIDELANPPDLVDKIEAARGRQRIIASSADLASRVGELIEHMRFHERLVADMLIRLEQVGRWLAGTS